MFNNTYIPRFSENDYVANGWIKSAEPDVMILNTSASETNPSPKPNDRAWATPISRPSPPTFVFVLDVSFKNKIFSFFRDLIITAESRPPTAAHSSRTLVNGRTSTLPPPSDYEMIIGLFRFDRFSFESFTFVFKRQRSNE